MSRTQQLWALAVTLFLAGAAIVAGTSPPHFSWTGTQMRVAYALIALAVFAFIGVVRSWPFPGLRHVDDAASSAAPEARRPRRPRGISEADWLASRPVALPAAQAVIADMGLRQPRRWWMPWTRQPHYVHDDQPAAVDAHQERLDTLQELIDEGGRLYDELGFGDLSNERYGRWIADHGAWRDRIRRDLPPADRNVANDFGGLNEPDPENERDLRPARARVDRIVSNLRRLYDEYHRGVR